MDDIKVTANLEEFGALVDKYKSQMPYATKEAINSTLLGTRKKLILVTQRRQKSNKKWWNDKRYGIKRTFANKKKLFASIRIGMYWARLQEKGGIKRPHKGKHIAIPTDQAPAYAKKSGGVKRLLNEGKKVWATEKGIFRRKGPKKRPRVERLHTFARQAVIDRPILTFYKTVGNYVRRNLPREIRKKFLHAVKTAK